MPVLHQYEPEIEDEDDCEDERCLPYVSRCLGAEDLDPQPPYGWWAMLRYDSQYQPVSPDEVAMWLHCIVFAQSSSRLARTRKHMICREPKGDRVLVIHPDLLADAVNIIDQGNDLMMRVPDRDGAWFRRQDLLFSAAKTFLRRLWRTLSVGRIGMDLQVCGHDPGIAMRRDGLDDLDWPGQIFELAELAAPAFPHRTPSL